MHSVLIGELIWDGKAVGCLGHLQEAMRAGVGRRALSRQSHEDRPYQVGLLHMQPTSVLAICIYIDFKPGIRSRPDDFSHHGLSLHTKSLNAEHHDRSRAVIIGACSGGVEMRMKWRGDEETTSMGMGVSKYRGD